MSIAVKNSHFLFHLKSRFLFFLCFFSRIDFVLNAQI